MSTVQEIESAIERLPRDQKNEIREWLEKVLDGGPRPEGYFASDYPLPEDRMALEEAMSKLPQKPDR
jgi:hypothetical protein